MFQLFTIHYLLICVSHSVPQNREANYALSNEHLCELYMTTEIVSAESQESLTDCDMEIDRIANVQNGKGTKTDIVRKMC